MAVRVILPQSSGINGFPFPSPPVKAVGPEGTAKLGWFGRFGNMLKFKCTFAHLGAYYQLGLLYARNGEKEKSKDAMEMQRQLNAQLHKGLIALRMP